MSITYYYYIHPSSTLNSWPSHRLLRLLYHYIGKVAAHSEGLNAADWNWDAEYSLDHNLFAFLLDHNRDRSSSE